MIPSRSTRSNSQSSLSDNIEEKIDKSEYFGLYCIKFKPAMHVHLFCVVTLFRAFNAVLTLDVFTCLVYSIFVLIEEIQRPFYDMATYLEFAKTLVLVGHGGTVSIGFKRCLIDKQY